MLKEKVSIPMRIIYAMRNPFDIMSTKMNYVLTDVEKYHSMKAALNSTVDKLKVKKDRLIYFFDRAEATVEAVDVVFGRMVVHNCDLMDNPRKTITQIFNFMDMSEQYLEQCAAKVFTRSRDTIVWPPKFREMVESKMRKYKMLDRYSFTSD